MLMLSTEEEAVSAAASETAELPLTEEELPLTEAELLLTEEEDVDADVSCSGELTVLASDDVPLRSEDPAELLPDATISVISGTAVTSDEEEAGFDMLPHAFMNRAVPSRPAKRSCLLFFQ